jgi:[acyl-carrier-protein] S-malonyltransferase
MVAFLFPGQGSQYAGMGKDLYDAYLSVRDLFALASDTIGLDMRRILFESTAEELKSTDKAQIAITLHSLSAVAALRGHGVVPQGAAGFSLGEFPALAASGVLSFESVFRAVKKRGELMENASRLLDDPAGSPGMAAVMGLEFPAAAKAIHDSGLKDLYAVNYNSPTQTVVSGTAKALAEGERILREAGAKRFIPLKVSGPFHSPLMENARKEFERVIAQEKFSDPAIPLYANVTGARVATGEDARSFCVRQIVSPVLWVPIEKNLMTEGYTQAFEVGPGNVLSGLFKSLSESFICAAAGKREEIENIAKEKTYASQG